MLHYLFSPNHSHDIYYGTVRSPQNLPLIISLLGYKVSYQHCVPDSKNIVTLFTSSMDGKKELYHTTDVDINYLYINAHHMGWSIV